MRVDNTAFYFTGHERVAQENKLAKESISKLAERPVSVSISKEGYESYRNSIQDNGKALSYDQVAEQRKMLADVKMDSDTDFGYRLSLEANQLNEKDKTSANGGFSWQARVENYAEAYANLYDEIVQGYTDGTRKINIMDENSELGYRTLTMEEELSALDAVYEKTVKGFEESAKQQQKAQGIIKEWSEDIEKIKSGGSSVAPVSSQKDQVSAAQKLPDDLVQKMLSVRDSWKVSYLEAGKDAAWNNIVSILNAMFK